MKNTTIAAAFGNAYLEVMKVVEMLDAAEERLDETAERLEAFANEIDAEVVEISEVSESIEARHATLELVDLIATLRDKVEAVSARVDRDALVVIKKAALDRNPNADLRHFGR